MCYNKLKISYIKNYKNNNERLCIKVLLKKNNYYTVQENIINKMINKSELLKI